MKWARPAAVAGLLALGLWIQLHFLRHYPQPVLFGDPAGYYSVGQRFEEAVARVRHGESAGAVFQSVRGLLYLAGVGAVFAALDALRPGDFAFFRMVMAVFNTLGMFGAFLLGRRLAGHFGGGLIALALAAIYPSFSVQTGRLYPDPITGCLLVWAAWLYAEALLRERGRAKLMAAGGAVFMTALLVRSQVFAYLTLVLALVLLAAAPRWARHRDERRLAGALALGCLPFLFAWAGILRAVGPRDDVVQLGNATFHAPYLFGFWQFLDTDGWIGPYRFKTEPYYQALTAAARDDRELMRSRARQAVFALRYAGGRPLDSALLVLDNAYRLYDRPANDYKWDYPFSYPWQVGLQRLIVLLAVAGLPLLAARRPALLGVYLVPVALAILHGLVFPWPRYNLPAMPTVIAIAGASAWLLAVRAAPAWRRPAAVLGLGLGCLLLGLMTRDAAPEAARALRLGGVLLALASLFVTAAAHRAIAFAAGSSLAVLVLAHAARDRRWHEVATVLDDDTPAVEQEIALGPEAVNAIRDAPEAFLVLDLRVPRGDLSGLALEVGDQRLPGSALEPTMPRLPESTSTGGRDWRGYPQWWALRLDGPLREQAAQPLVRVRLRYQGGPPLLLSGDRFQAQGEAYEGPSFGEWPRFVPLKLEYDGDYRIGARYPLQSAGTRSFMTREQRGARVVLRAAHRIRLITLAQSTGGLRFASAPLPRAAPVAMGLAAYAGDRG
ncbi:MAG TPA: hypothetical protein VF310_01010, partial [Vicinamibacteria bacterium]